MLKCFGFAGLSVVSFLIPGVYGERIGLTISAFLSFSVLQSYVNDFVPRGNTVPMISQYILSQLILSAICVTSGVLSLLLHSVRSPMSPWCKTASHYMATYLMLSTKHHDLNLEPNPNPNLNPNSNPNLNQSLANHDKTTTGHNHVTINLQEVNESVAGRQKQTTTVCANGLIWDTATDFSSNSAYAYQQDDAKSKNKVNNADWQVLNDVINRVFLIVCSLAIVTLTLYFMLTMQINGSSTA